MLVIHNFSIYVTDKIVKCKKKNLFKYIYSKIMSKCLLKIG